MESKSSSPDRSENPLEGKVFFSRNFVAPKGSSLKFLRKKDFHERDCNKERE
jgi:hypothetical protein